MVKNRIMRLSNHCCWRSSLVAAACGDDDAGTTTTAAETTTTTAAETTHHRCPVELMGSWRSARSCRRPGTWPSSARR